MKIYLIGKCVEPGMDTRNINIINALLNIGDVYYDGFFLFENLKNRYLRKILRIFINIFRFPIKVLYLLNSDVVIVLAMNQNKIFEIYLAKLLKKKIITDYYISNYDTYILDRKIYSPTSFIAKFYKFQDRVAISKANKVIFLNSTEARRYIKLSETKNIEKNYEIIPLCKKELNFERGNLPFFKKTNDRINICWWGTYIPLHGIEKIILAGEILKKKNIKFKIYLFGNSEEKAKIYKKKIEELNLNKEIIINNEYSFLNKKLPKFLIKNCDIALGNFGDSEKAKTVMVNKIVDALQLGLPVLNGESIAPDEFFDYKNDIFRCLNTPEDLANKIIEISKESREEIEKRVKKEYEIYKNNFSYENFEKRIKEIVNNI